MTRKRAAKKATRSTAAESGTNYTTAMRSRESSTDRSRLDPAVRDAFERLTGRSVDTVPGWALGAGPVPKRARALALDPRFLVMTPNETADGRLPYTSYLFRGGEQGQPAYARWGNSMVEGFLRDADDKTSFVDWTEVWQQPSLAIGLYPVWADQIGRLGTARWTVQSMTWGHHEESHDESYDPLRLNFRSPVTATVIPTFEVPGVETPEPFQIEAGRVVLSWPEQYMQHVVEQGCLVETNDMTRWIRADRRLNRDRLAERGFVSPLLIAENFYDDSRAKVLAAWEDHIYSSEAWAQHLKRLGFDAADPAAPEPHVLRLDPEAARALADYHA